MRTANNMRFLGYLEGTPQAEILLRKRAEWTARWLADAEIAPVFAKLLVEKGGDVAHPTRDGAAWEATVEPLRAKFNAAQLGFGKTDLYRVVPKDLLANEDDFVFAWQERKKELLKHWRTEKRLKSFWQQLEISANKLIKRAIKDDLSDQDFCDFCQMLQKWLAAENAKRKAKLPREVLGLRSSEDYVEPDDAPRIATIYNGLYGRAQFVPFRKGDPEGNRWADNDPLFIEWSHANAIWLFKNSGRPESQMPVIRNAHLYFTEGVTWSLHANHVAIKSRYQDACVFDASGSRLTPNKKQMNAVAFLGVVNSDVFSFFLKRFVKHNQDVDINDMRMMPIVIPTKAQERKLTDLATRAMAAKRLSFSDGEVPNELAKYARELAAELEAKAPAYLRPPAQAMTFQKPEDCLTIIELAVNWEAEKLYGVEGLGPFDDF